MNDTRVFSPYEQTQLARHGLLMQNLDDFGETPVEYITHSVPFYSQDFAITPDVLIPRIETEQLVNITLDTIKSKPTFQMNGILTIADIGTGSGAIGITVSSLLSQLDTHHSLFYSDISRKALDIAEANARSLLPFKKSNKVTSFFVHSDLLSGFPPSVKFDVIIANLPYVPSRRISTLHESVKDYEPHLALDGGPDGLDLIFALLSQAKQYLKNNGTILLEIDHTHGREHFDEFNTLYSLDILQDANRLNRFAIMQKL